MNRIERAIATLSGTDADRPLLSYARMLASMGLARHYYFVHVRTAARNDAEPQSNALVLRKCEDMVAENFAFQDMKATCSCHVLEGIRIDKLIEFISLQRCDLALVGHRKIRSGQRSLAKRLAMIAPCSVWLVPDEAPTSITNIMVPIDFSDNAADSVVVATSIAKAAGLSECLATHVFSDPSMIRYDERIGELRNNEQAAFENFVAPIECHGIKVEATFVEGHNVARTLLHTAERYGTDLIVMNTRGRSRAASILLGSVTTQVMAEVATALLAVKHAGAMMSLFQALHENKSWMQPANKTN